MIKLSAIILAKNEETMIKDCLKSVSFCDEIIMIDSGSKDKTVAIAKEKGVRVYEELSADFAAKRNLGLSMAKGEWVLYIDADERISEALASEIAKSVEQSAKGKFGEIAIYKLRRKNFYLGDHPWPQIEEMERLFKKEALKKWHGALHESPVYVGEVGLLNGELLHYTHRDLSQMVAKTNQWSETEAELRLKADHPEMTWWRFPRVMITAFSNSYFKQGGWKVGTAGLVESMYQAFSAFITYAKLWELQNKKSSK